jgi:hypothetical protein
MNRFADVHEWAHPKMCDRNRFFLGADDGACGGRDGIVAWLSTLADSDADELLVLDVFEHSFVDANGGLGNSMGLVMSTRRLLCTMALAAYDQVTELLVSTDGTYRRHFGGWTLVDIGFTRLVFHRRDYVHSLVPCAYLFVRTETQYGYERVVMSLVDAADAFFGFALKPLAASIDHSSAIANALQVSWPDVVLLSCWPHVLRNTREKKSLLASSENYDATIAPHLQWLHLCRSAEQHRALGALVVAAWRASDHGTYADWFENQYLAPRWSRWYVTASGVAGIVPNQNPIEAHHRSIKRCVNLRAATGVVLNESLPRKIFSIFDLSHI